MSGCRSHIYLLPMSLIPDYFVHTTYEDLTKGARKIKRTSRYEVERYEEKTDSKADEINDLFGIKCVPATAWTDRAYHDRRIEYKIEQIKQEGYRNGTKCQTGGKGSCYVMPAGYSNDYIAFTLDGERVDAEIWTTPEAAVVEWNGESVRSPFFNASFIEIMLIHRSLPLPDKFSHENRIGMMNLFCEDAYGEKLMEYSDDLNKISRNLEVTDEDREYYNSLCTTLHRKYGGDMSIYNVPFYFYHEEVEDSLISHGDYEGKNYVCRFRTTKGDNGKQVFNVYLYKKHYYNLYKP